MPSEKCAAGWGNDGDEMRMITASLVRSIERFARDLFSHFHPRFQQLAMIRKTCNQLYGCVTLHSYPCYVEAGLPKPRVLLWVYGEQ